MSRRVLLVSSDAAHNRTVAQSFQGLPLTLAKNLPDGQSALRYARVYAPDILMLDDSLTGPNVSGFMGSWRASLGLRHIPTVITMAAAQRDGLVEAVSLGCVGFLIKPCAPANLRKHLSTALGVVEENDEHLAQLRMGALGLASGQYDEAIAEFEAAVELADESENLFKKGMHAMGLGDYATAVQCLRHAVRLNSFFAEAYEALAKCYMAKGDGAKSRHFLKLAAHVHAEFNRREHARRCFVEILNEEPNAANPFELLGKRLIRQNDYKGALQALESALELTPEDPDILFQVAKLYHFFGHRNKAVDVLNGLLAYEGVSAQAQRLLTHIQQTSWATIDAG